MKDNGSSPHSIKFRKRMSNSRNPAQQLFDEYANLYAAVYFGRRPNYFHYEESSGMMAIYVDSKIKVAAGNFKRIRELIKQLKDKHKEQSRNG